VLTTFFITKGTVHFEFIPQDQTVNQAYYVEILKLCVEKGQNFGPRTEFSTMTAPAHKALYVKQFLAQKSII
jgi:hypothetical protein